MGKKEKSLMLPFIINFSSAAYYFLPHPLWIVFFFFFHFIYLFRLCWVFIAFRGKDIGLIAVAHKFCCPVECGIFPDKALKLCPYIGRQILNHWITSEVPTLNLKNTPNKYCDLAFQYLFALSDYFSPKYRWKFYKFW